jgi:hypothetical protein
MRSYTILLTALLITTCAQADYLELRRTTFLKSEPNTSSTNIVKLSPDTTVILVQDKQQNGYYKVKVSGTGQQGWVYRTMGRRYSGLPDLAPAGSSVPSEDKAPPTEDAFSVPTKHKWGNPSKTSACHSNNGLPDPDCTPGDINSETSNLICSSSFRTGSVRNKTTSQGQKNQVYPMYDVTHPEHNTGSTQVCEIDHLVPLELGGADTMANLWPQCSPGYENWQGPGFRDKDGFENYLWFHVCVNEDISLHDAQNEIATNWRKYWELAGKPECRNRNKCE